VREADRSSHLVPRFRMSGALLPLPRTHSTSLLLLLSHAALETLEKSHSGMATSCRYKPVVESETRQELNMR
jgi:hypothetical protein